MQKKIVLAVDTSSPVASFAIAQEQRLLAAIIGEVQRPHSQTFFAHLNSLLENAGIGLSEVDILAGVTGPGSFTGLRVGLAAIKGIAQAAKYESLGLNIFDLEALGAGTSGRFLVLLEAGRNDLFAGAREVVGENVVRLNKPDCVGTVKLIFEKFREEIESGIALIGNGLPKYNQTISTSSTVTQLLASNPTPLASRLALQAVRLLNQGFIPPLRAYYLRPSDAETKFAI